MWVKRHRRWETSSRPVTPKTVYLNRRQFVAALGLAGSGLVSSAAAGTTAGLFDLQESADTGRRPDWLEVPDWPAADRYPAPANVMFGRERIGRPLTDEAVAARYNNFYELSPRKERVWRLAERLETRPWTLEVDGLVAKPRVFDVDGLLRRMPLEERIYSLRCVEAWSMVVPWTGFPLRELLQVVEPLDGARYLRFETLMRPRQMPGIGRQRHYPWPYGEGLHILEARNELALLASGIYGHPLPKQHGAPLRLVVPWKYGFKSIKSIVRITFTAEQPATFWSRAVPREYGFWANVNPDVPHARWSQATERPIPDGDPIPTQIFNGYGEQVAHLYREMEGRLAFY